MLENYILCTVGFNSILKDSGTGTGSQDNTILLGETIFWGDILLKERQSVWASTLAEPVLKVFQFLPELPRKILSWVNPFECLIKQPGKSICVRRQKSSLAGLSCQLAGKILFSGQSARRNWNAFGTVSVRVLPRDFLALVVIMLPENIVSSRLAVPGSPSMLQPKSCRK